MAKRALVERAVKSLQAMHAAGQHQRNAVAARALGLSGIAAPPAPPMPDVREPRVGGGAASPSTRIKPRDQPPLYPGMRCALKPEFIDERVGIQDGNGQRWILSILDEEPLPRDRRIHQ